MLVESNEWGPATWQRDANAEVLRGRWQQALGYLKSLRDRKDPSPFYSELFGKLRRDFDIAKSWLNERPAYDPEIARFRLLPPVIEEIEDIWDRDFQLENSFYLSEGPEQG